MAQQEIVVMPDGGEWEWDPEIGQYACLHVDVVIQTDDEPTYNGFEIGSRDYKWAECQNCGADVSETYDWDYDPREDDYKDE